MMAASVANVRYEITAEVDGASYNTIPAKKLMPNRKHQMDIIYIPTVTHVSLPMKVPIRASAPARAIATPQEAGEPGTSRATV